MFVAADEGRLYIKGEGRLYISRGKPSVSVHCMREVVD